MDAPPSTQGRSPRGVDLTMHVRRSIVLVRGFRGTASGWIALPNGVVMTNRSALGYQADAAIEMDDGSRIDARVVWADVARDVALLLPSRRSSAPALPMVAEAARLGETLYVVGRTATRAILFAPVVVCAIEGSSRSSVLRLAPSLGRDARGAVVVDAQGRALAVILDAPRPTANARAITLHSISEGLAFADAPPAHLANRGPTYRCAACNEALSPETERCARCGTRLADTGAGDGFDPVDRVVNEMLAKLGIVALRARVAPRAWRIAVKPKTGEAPVVIELRADTETRDISLRIPVVNVPRNEYEPFYRLLLTLNDQTTQEARLGVEGDVAYLSFTEPADLLEQREPERLVDELVAMAEHFRSKLAAAFGAAPIREPPDGNELSAISYQRSAF